MARSVNSESRSVSANRGTDRGTDRAAARASGPVAATQALAARQHGVVSRWQLLRVGSTRHSIDHQVKRGWLELIHRGVYRVGVEAAPHQREMAALLACGAGVVLSHQSAAVLWELLPPPGAMVPVTVSTTRHLRGRSSGFRVVRTRGLGADEVSHLGSLRLTNVSRTLLDLAGSLSAHDLERAMAQANQQRLLDTRQLELLLTRYPRRSGRARIAALLNSPDGPLLTRSEAEARFLALIRKGGLRLPETNVVVQGFEVDVLWRAERLVVEIDGFAFHATRAAFERDRQRDRVLAAAGLCVIRVTWSELILKPEMLLVQLAETLACRRAP